MASASLTERPRGGLTMVYDPDFQDLPDKRPKGFRAKGEPTPPVALWSWVYIANLPLPAYFGADLSFGLGLPGLVAGVVLLYEVGRRSCHACPWAIRRVSHGGVVVAAVQLYPVIHMIIGKLAVDAAFFIVPWDVANGTRLGPATALVATVVMGLILIAWAGAMGLIGRAVCLLAESRAP
ncbi:hypothetical protein [Paludisphaera sp.]|uniref:hypothetical protein n=1 Tax=Paludisphaera sp. TaxID=2017432 RepID=UPI00301E1EE3